MSDDRLTRRPAPHPATPLPTTPQEAPTAMPESYPLDADIVDSITNGAADLLEEQGDRHLDSLVEGLANAINDAAENIKSRRLRWLVKLIPMKSVLAEVGEYLLAFLVKFLRDFRDKPAPNAN